MYLARFHNGEPGGLVQGAVRIRREPPPGSSAWWRECRRLVTAVTGVEPLSVVLRITFRPDRALERLVVVTCRGEREQTLRRWFAAWTRLDLRLAGMIELAPDAATFDAWLAATPERATLIEPPHFVLRNGACWVPRLRLYDRIDAIVENAMVMGYPLTYALHLQPITPNIDTWRQGRRELLRLTPEEGVPESVAAGQLAQVETYGRATFDVEEVLALEEPLGEEHLANVLADRLPEPVRPRIATAELVHFKPAQTLEGLKLGVHSGVLYDEGRQDAASAIAAAEPSDFIVEAMTKPFPAAHDTGDRDGPLLPGKDDPRGRLSPAPCRWPVQPFEGEQGFMFVSYSRADSARIAGLIPDVQRVAPRIWYDAGIPGGVEWDAHIEQRLTAAAGVLVFLSANAIASRYVRREIKFADAIGKPCLVVLLEQVKLMEGLGLRLGGSQMLNAACDDFPSRVGRALAEVMPEVTRSGHASRQALRD